MNDQLTLDVQLRSDWNFDNFHIAENQQVVSYLQNINKQWTSIFIWGEQASGKTHLLNALCHDYQFKHPEVSLVYLPLAEDYDFSASCLDGLESCDLVCIDDIDKMLANDEWEQSLFHFINRMKDNERALVLSSSQPLKKLTINLPDLRSRLSEALNLELKPLKGDDLLTVLNQKAFERGIRLDEEVLAYIEKRGPRSMSSLVDLLDTLDKESLKEKRVITVPFLKKFVSW
jgi:DnaA family protein